MIFLREKAIGILNALGTQKEPFLFFTDFEGSKAFVSAVSDLKTTPVFFQIDDNHHLPEIETARLTTFNKSPISFEDFQMKYDSVIDHIRKGDSFLTNLACKTPIDTNLSLKDIFSLSKAPYKLLFDDSFVVFSPEKFIEIKDDYIYSHPMKGTIDGRLNNARDMILNDPKETAEHVTIVDLIRNDLSQVANEVTVEKFRYITEIQTNEKQLLQVSSEIRGVLNSNWNEQIGNILFKLLPAGSISGAPKPKTVDIIKKVEGFDREYFTGVFGIFDGSNFISAVMIRFIEKKDNQLYFKSGVGVTSRSDAHKEYQEMIDKIYVPIY
ncbi:MAG: aminodeoxychorismate synthase component I [Bacteroidetes bacterium]|nr:aminodeoxychorismate synthase component I [Bacteroidota bacterium]MDA1120559.1 aminodeoxychorismate synthase component I [Bacteroidota bacterium]